MTNSNTNQDSSKFDSTSFNSEINKKVNEAANEINKIMDEARSNKKVLGGTILILLGVLFLLDNLFPHFNFGDYWPIILIAIGVGILIKATIKYIIKANCYENITNFLGNPFYSIGFVSSLK